MKAERAVEPVRLARRRRPRLVIDRGQVVADAVVIVSPKDPNWWKGPEAIYTDGVVQVRRVR